MLNVRTFIIKDKIFDVVPFDKIDNDAISKNKKQHLQQSPKSLVMENPNYNRIKFSPQKDATRRYTVPEVDFGCYKDAKIKKIWDEWTPRPQYQTKYLGGSRWQIRNTIRDLRLFWIVPEDDPLDFQKLIDTSPPAEPFAIFLQNLYNGVQKIKDWRTLDIRLPYELTPPNLDMLKL